MSVRIDFLESSNFLEGEVIEDTENYIVVDDDMYGVCKVVKDDNTFIYQTLELCL